MKIIKFFIASSIDEFFTERQSLKAFISQLNDIYIRRGIYFELILCEYLSNAIQKYGSQEMYNSKIRECDYFYILVGKDLGEYTLQEYEVAIDHFKKNDTPYIYPYFLQLDNEQNTSATVLAFMKKLDQELKHYYSRFTDINSVKLNMLLELVASPDISGFVSFKDGQATVDNQPVLDLHDIPAYRNSSVIADLFLKKQKLEVRFAQLSQELQQANDDKKYVEWLNISHEKEQIDKSLYHHEEELLSLFSTVAKLKKSERKLSWREQCACEMIDSGNTDAAISLLKDSSREKELSIAEKMIEAGHSGITTYISENRLLIKLLRTSDIPEKIIPELTKYYMKNIELERLYHVEPRCYTDYISFLDYQKDYITAKQLSEELLLQYDIEKLPNSGSIFTTLGLLYAKIPLFDDAKKFLERAFQICVSSNTKDPETYANCCNNLGYILSEYPAKQKEAEYYYLEGISCINNSNITDNELLLHLYTNLGVLLHGKQQNDAAEEYYKKAIEICNSLYNTSPVYYLPLFCTLHNNLGNLYMDVHKITESVIAFETAILFLKPLSQYNASAFSPELARTYNNFGLMLSLCTQDRARAETMYKDALEIRRNLYRKNSDTYKIDLAQTLNNLATHLSFDTTRRNPEIEKLFKEALKIRKELDPQLFLHLVAQTHHDFANYYAFIRNRNEANAHFKESIKLFEMDSTTNTMSDYWRAQTLCDYGAFLFNTYNPPKSFAALNAFNQAKQALRKFDCTRPPFSNINELINKNISTVLSNA